MLDRFDQRRRSAGQVTLGEGEEVRERDVIGCTGACDGSSRVMRPYRRTILRITVSMSIDMTTLPLFSKRVQSATG